VRKYRKLVLPHPLTFYLITLKCLAGFYTFAAGLGALLAVVVLVPAALIGTLLANFDALFDKVRGMRRVAGDKSGREPADIGAVAVGADAADHHLHVVFGEAGVGAVFAGGYAGSGSRWVRFSYKQGNELAMTFVAWLFLLRSRLAGRWCKVWAGRVQNAGLARHKPEFCTSLALTLPASPATTSPALPLDKQFITCAFL
jgi:hypothetical protein